MNFSPTEIAVGAVRCWVHLYTAGLDHTLREERRDEIECDLWEQSSNADLNDEPPGQTAWQVIDRCLRGMAADIFWRFSLKGEPRLVSQNLVVRAGGVAMLLIVASMIGLFAAGFGIGTGEYFREEFPKWASDTPRHEVAFLFGGLVSLAAVFGAAALFWTFKPYQPLIAAAGAAVLVVAGLVMIAALTAGVALIDIANEWTARGAVIEDGVWASAHHVARIHEALGFISAMLFVASLAIFGGLIAIKGAVPRWAGWIGAASGLALILALVGSALSEGVFWWTFVTSGTLGLLWLVMTGGWLAIKGVYESP